MTPQLPSGVKSGSQEVRDDCYSLIRSLCFDSRGYLQHQLAFQMPEWWLSLLAMVFPGLRSKSATNVLNQSELKPYWQVKETKILQHGDRLKRSFNHQNAG